jgi:T5SS/PEP-CTERM-associated repeat protein
MKRTLAVLVIGVLGLAPAWAEDNTTQYFTGGGVSNVTGDVICGNTGTNNYLEVSNGTTLNNTGEGVVSYNAVASNNVAVVSGVGSSWNPASWMFVGRLGAFGRLIITNGASASAAGSYIGYYYATTANNKVMVTGPGSSWKLGASGLYVGGAGCNNQLLIENGGSVTSVAATIIGNSVTATNNLLRVTGTGSTFVRTGGDFVMNGLGSTLMADTGGQVISPNVRLYSATNGQVIVTNGGYVQVAGASVGETAVAFGNNALVTGSGSIFTNSGGTTVGGTSTSSNKMTVKNGGTAYSSTFSMGTSGSANDNQLIVDGAGSLYKNGVDFAVGGAGTNNMVIVTNGGTLLAGQIEMSASAAGVSNSVKVTGAGSAISNQYALFVGYYGSFNQMTVENGGRLHVGATYYTALSYIAASSSNNTAIVKDSGSVWTNAGEFYLGYAGDNNQVTVSGGGRLDAAKDLYLGLTGTSQSNKLIVSDGGQVTVDGYGRVGYAVGAQGDVLVTGPGSLLRAGHLGVGSNYFTVGQGSITVQDGGTIETSDLQDGKNGTGNITNNGGIFQFATATPNVSVTTPNSIIVNSGTIAYRNVTAANIANTEIAKFTFQGENGFRLNNASNATGLANYTFDNTLGPAHYARLDLVNGGTLFQAGSITIGSGGAMLASNTAATISGAYTNNGTLTVYNSTLTFLNPAVLNGTTVINVEHLASTNGAVRGTDLTLGPSSALQITGVYTSKETRVLFRNSGTRAGTFSSVSALSNFWHIAYGTPLSTDVSLVYAPGGTAILIR